MKGISTSSSKFFSSLTPEMVSPKKEGFIWSPYSIFSVFCLALGGTKGDTKNEIVKALHVVDEKKIHQEISAVNKLFNKTKALSIAQGMFFCLKDEEIQPNYITFAQKYYSALIKPTSFPNPGLKQVNTFIERKTKGMLKDVVDHLDKNVKVVLVNCVYFKATWKDQFQKKFTKRENFSVYGKEDIKVSMMGKLKAKRVPYADVSMNNVDFSSVRLDYKGRKFGMIFVKLKENTIEAMENFEKSVLTDPDFIKTVGNKFLSVTVKKLQIPKFTIETKFETIVPQMKKIGIKMAFTPNQADLGDMTKIKGLYFSDVVHAAKMIVDEKGTEAAAATVMVSRGFSHQTKTYEFILKQPFYVFLINNKSNLVLFTAKIIEPSFKK